MKKGRIVLVTTGQPSTNPRIVKEADALHQEGYEVFLLYSFWADWALNTDNELLKTKKFTAVLLGGSPKSQRILYLFTRLRYKLIRLFDGFLSRDFYFCRAYFELFERALSLKADLYIAHNVGALPIVSNVAQRVNAKYAFDAEDFYRGETDLNSQTSKKIKDIEDKHLPLAQYISAASPLIAEIYSKLYPRKKIITINNVFPKLLQEKFREKNTCSGLKLLWFSQTISLYRGLQDLIKAMNMIKEAHIKLTIIGLGTQEKKDTLVQILEKDSLHTIKFIDPVEENELFKIAVQHDIGLALETGFSMNNRIALSNKIFTYLLCGNAIIVSDTNAQKRFMEEHPNIGFIYPVGDVCEVVYILKKYIYNNLLLNEHSRKAWLLANEKLNWSVEKFKFLNEVESIL